jgi:hypothetical protein
MDTMAVIDLENKENITRHNKHAVIHIGKRAMQV